ncbi:tellurite resistance protein TerC [Brevibacterium sanguinis]|uniref:Tellurite resistance protein TerC n=2 Tax=Brevibacterium TaxID=1696 RepID=A0A366IKC1_9MICO|nr:MULTISPECIES: TerC family protein [Brevibacterium]RBP64617.1 tellurite resistance protein TerC [Brevibacterium sanguinis]RBP71740.1 tellurite resistance protein TerC [Brevibacterium celere]
MDTLSSTLAAGETAAASGSVIPMWFMIGSGIAVVAILIFDLLLVVKRPHVPTMREAGIWVGFYVFLALVFAGALFAIGDAQHGSEFLTGWLLEYSLSIDNLFVFIIIMTSFGVPRKYQQEVLMVGIIIAIVFRGIFIVAGAAIISAFVEVFFLFGIFLLIVAYRQAFSGEDDENAENGLIRLLRKKINVVDEFHGNKLRVEIEGTKYWTPMFIVFIAIGSTDVMFALDSIPAIFGVTQNAFLVFTANVFALMGLRQLYFLLGGLVDKLVYLHYGIAAILAFIGVKLVIHALHETDWEFLAWGHSIPEVPTWLSLSFIVVAMAVATIASLMKMKKDGVSFRDVGPQESETSHD